MYHYQLRNVVTARPTGICAVVFAVVRRALHSMLSQAIREMYCATVHWARPTPGLRPKPHIPSAAAKIRATENSPAIRSGERRTSDNNQIRNIVSPYLNVELAESDASLEQKTKSGHNCHKQIRNSVLAIHVLVRIIPTLSSVLMLRPVLLLLLLPFLHFHTSSSSSSLPCPSSLLFPVSPPPPTSTLSCSQLELV